MTVESCSMFNALSRGFYLPGTYLYQRVVFINQQENQNSEIVKVEVFSRSTMPHTSLPLRRTNYNKLIWPAVSILVFFSMWLVFSNFLPARQALIRTIVATVFFSGIIFLNLKWLLPAYFQRQQFVKYGALVVLMGVVITFIRYLLEEKWQIPVSTIRPHDSLEFSERQKFFTLFFAHSIVFLLSLTYYFGKAWMETEKREALLNSQRLEAEINFLRSQINPHFLLNILNNLYALSYLKDERTPDMLLKLSDMMRYLIYESNQTYIPLRKEINFFYSYTELQKLKSRKFENMTIRVNGIEDSHQIPSLLLLPFFENIFKHCDIESNPKGMALIELTVDKNKLTLFTSNTTRKKKAESHSSGFGLSTVKKRLQLLYPGQHTLVLNDGEDSFECKLEIPIT